MSWLFLVVAEFRERFVKGTGIQINHQRAERRAMCIQASHLAAMGFPQSMQAVDDVDVEVEEGVAPRDNSTRDL